MEEQTQQQPTPEPETPKKKFYKKWWFWIVILLIPTLIVFFFPKTKSVTFPEATRLDDMLHCECMGFSVEEAKGRVTCYGIVYDCYTGLPNPDGVSS